MCDQFKAHVTESTKRLTTKLKIYLAVIPGGLTSQLQSLDVSVKPFKGFMHEEWAKWIEAQTHHVTPAGKVKRLKLYFCRVQNNKVGPMWKLFFTFGFMAVTVMYWCRETCVISYVDTLKCTCTLYILWNLVLHFWRGCLKLILNGEVIYLTIEIKYAAITIKHRNKFSVSKLWGSNCLLKCKHIS